MPIASGANRWPKSYWTDPRLMAVELTNAPAKGTPEDIANLAPAIKTPRQVDGELMAKVPSGKNSRRTGEEMATHETSMTTSRVKNEELENRPAKVKVQTSSLPPDAADARCFPGGGSTHPLVSDFESFNVKKAAAEVKTEKNGKNVEGHTELTDRATSNSSDKISIDGGDQEKLVPVSSSKFRFTFVLVALLTIVILVGVGVSAFLIFYHLMAPQTQMTDDSIASPPPDDKALGFWYEGVYLQLGGEYDDADWMKRIYKMSMSEHLPESRHLANQTSSTCAVCRSPVAY